MTKRQFSVTKVALAVRCEGAQYCVTVRTTHRPGVKVPRLRVKTEELQKRRRAVGIADTHIALAEYIGVNHGTISRIFSGKSAPGERFITALVGAFPGSRLDDLFEIVEDSPDRAA